MKPTEQDELVDAIHKQSAHVRRLEDATAYLFGSIAELAKAIKSLVEVIEKVAKK